MYLSELIDRAKTIEVQRSQGYPLNDHPLTRDRITRARLKDLPTHARHIARALGRSSPDDVTALELTEENREIVATYLLDQGKGQGVIGNTTSSFRLFRDLAREEGIDVFVLPALIRPKRQRVYQKEADGVYRKAARSEYVSNNAKYGLRQRDWPEALLKEYEAIVTFYTQPFAEHRNCNMLRETTMDTQLNRFERAFGIEVARGIPKEDLGFRRLCEVSTLRAHHQFLRERSKGLDTDSLRGYLDLFRSLALNFYEDKEQADAITKYMKNRCKFKKVKDKQFLVERIHPDDLYHVLECLVAEARHYESTVGSKYGRKDPLAQMAFHWHQAAVWGFTLATLLRQQNVVNATARHIYKEPDGTWHYRYSADEMKSGRAKSDEVVDLWRGEAAMGLVRLALDKAVEMRPHLLARFRRSHPNAPEPQAFFLNMDGKAYAPSAMRLFFNSAAVRYLGPEKRISQHDIRAVVASWLFVREGYEIMEAVQNHLDHAHPSTTEQHYVKIKNIFGSRLAVKQMEERQKHKKMMADLYKLPDQLAAMLSEQQRAIEQTLNELRDAISPVALQELNAALATISALGSAKTDER